jgi:hypothetical protein
MQTGLRQAKKPPFLRAAERESVRGREREKPATQGWD